MWVREEGCREDSVNFGVVWEVLGSNQPYALGCPVRAETVVDACLDVLAWEEQ